MKVEMEEVVLSTLEKFSDIAAAQDRIRELESELAQLRYDLVATERANEDTRQKNVVLLRELEIFREGLNRTQQTCIDLLCRRPGDAP